MAEAILYRAGGSSKLKGADATPADVLQGKKFYVTDTRTLLTGTIPSKAATTYYPTTVTQTIEDGQYLAGDQTIVPVTTANIAAGNIKSGVTVTVGDSTLPNRIIEVEGTFTSDGNVTSSDQILEGFVAYSKGVRYSGTIPTYDGTVD